MQQLSSLAVLLYLMRWMAKIVGLWRKILDSRISHLLVLSSLSETSMETTLASIYVDAAFTNARRWLHLLMSKTDRSLAVQKDPRIGLSTVAGSDFGLNLCSRNNTGSAERKENFITSVFDYRKNRLEFELFLPTAVRSPLSRHQCKLDCVSSW